MTFTQTHIDRLDRTTALVEANPSHWDQGIWHCGTTHCWAGFGDILANQWEMDHEFGEKSWLVTVDAEWYGLSSYAWNTITNMNNSLDNIKLFVAAAIKGQGDIDLSGADLKGATLSGLELSNANLFGAELRYADLSGTDLTGANLTGANLNGANLTEADLNGANLTEADLNGANLTEADLDGADFTSANLSCADLSGARLNGTCLTGANLSGATLDEMSLAN
jgi:hypothetical protein